jgi:putative phage-type endonuclease
MTTATQPLVMMRDEWLAHRKTGLGASDIPTILGVNRFRSPYTLWAEKRGMIPPPDENIPMRVGHALEPLVAELYTETTGQELTDPGPYTIFPHPDLPFLFCTPDRLHVADGRPVELKTAGEFAARDWKDADEPPIQHTCQNMTQIACVGADAGAVAGLVGNREFHYFDVPRNDRLIAHILRLAAEFWARVLNGDAPPVDGSDSTTRTLKALHPKDTGEEVVLPDLEADALAYTELCETLKKQEADKDLLKNRLVAGIGDASFAVFGGLRFSYKHQTRKGQIVVPDTALGLLIEHVIPYERKGESEYRVLRRAK